MIRMGKFAVCLAGGLVLLASARGQDSTTDSVNPYKPIVVRNVFNITPPPPVTNNDAQAADPPVKITPNGIMSIFGQMQVLFKVAVPAKPGQPAKDQSYILSEGQAQDEIEVTKIDEKASMVTFNNHGVIQELPLANAPGGGGSAPPSGGPGGGGMPGGFPMPRRFGGGNPGGGGFISSFGTRFGGRNSNASGGGNPAGNPGSGFGGGYGGGGFGGSTTSSTTGADSQNTMSAEEQMILVAAQHAKAQQEGDPSAAIFPPTPIDEDAGIK
jgi:hypothetical protein